MSKFKFDPLLLAAKSVIGLLIALLAAVTALLVFVALAVPVIALFMPGTITPDTLGEFTTSQLLILSLLIALMAIVVGLVVYLLRKLWQIIASVGDGDPFIPENAVRMRNMAFALLATYPIGVILILGMQWLDNIFDEESMEASFTFDGLDLGGLFTALILLILARVFRQGAAMRAELEGTV